MFIKLQSLILHIVSFILIELILSSPFHAIIVIMLLKLSPFSKHRVEKTRVNENPTRSYPLSIQLISYLSTFFIPLITGLDMNEYL